MLQLENFMPTKNKSIKYAKIGEQFQKESKILLKKISSLLNSGAYVGGKEIDIFEKNIAKRCGSKFAISMNSGTDALTIAMHLLGVRRGDEVITPPNSFIASTATIVHLGAKPVFADVLNDMNINPDEVGRKITKKTKAIMPVHLSGRIAEMDEIKKIAKKKNIPVIEDAAQAVGSLYKNKPSGSLGDMGCFSSHPLKNLNACGDGGYMTTNNFKIYQKAKSLVNHGMEKRNIIKNFGYVSRMDNLQALILNHRLDNLDDLILKRRKNARFYFDNLTSDIFIPEEKTHEFNTYHTFVIQTKKRNQLKKYLEKNGIPSLIHYPVPIHLQPAAKFLGHKKGDFPMTEKLSNTMLTLPINQELKLSELKYIVKTINLYFRR